MSRCVGGCADRAAGHPAVGRSGIACPTPLPGTGAVRRARRLDAILIAGNHRADFVGSPRRPHSGGTALRAGVLQRRPLRGWLAASLAWGATFALSLLAPTVWSNLDADGWRDARPLSWQVLPIIGLRIAGLAGPATRAYRSGCATGQRDWQAPVVSPGPGTACGLGVVRSESGDMEQRRPVEVGGWGYRGGPGRTTIMIRSGKCLVVRLVSGGEFGISVNDTDRGVACSTPFSPQRPAADRGVIPPPVGRGPAPTRRDSRGPRAGSHPQTRSETDVKITKADPGGEQHQRRE